MAHYAISLLDLAEQSTRTLPDHTHREKTTQAKAETFKESTAWDVEERCWAGTEICEYHRTDVRATHVGIGVVCRGKI